MKSPALIGVTCLALATLVSAAFIQGVAVGSAVSSSDHQFDRFYLRGTNGYKVEVVAPVEGSGSLVRIVVENQHGSAEYQVPGTVTPRKIRASYGELGNISLRFLPSARVLRSLGGGAGCSAHAKARLGIYVGTFRFRGESGYTTVNAHRIRGGIGAPTAPINKQEQLRLGCLNADETHIVPLDQIQQHFSETPFSEIPFEGPREKSTPGLGVLSVATAPNEATLFFAWRFSLRHPEEEGARPDFCIFGATNEETRGDVAIARSVFQGGPVSQCSFSESNATFNVAPEPPFNGTASFQRNADSSTTWLGSLNVPMLGRGPVALAGPSFKTELVKR